LRDHVQTFPIRTQKVPIIPIVLALTGTFPKTQERQTATVPSGRTRTPLILFARKCSAHRMTRTRGHGLEIHHFTRERGKVSCFFRSSPVAPRWRSVRRISSVFSYHFYFDWRVFFTRRCSTDIWNQNYADEQYQVCVLGARLPTN
jgi:hypothetical protein